MRKYDSIVNEINAVRKGKNRPWIFTEEGKLDTDKVVLVDTLDWLDVMSDYEVDMEYEYNGMPIEEFFTSPTYKLLDRNNTYNFLGNCTNNIDYSIFENVLTNEYFALVKIHLIGDIRCNYTDTMVLHFDDDGELNEFFNAYGYATITVGGSDYYVDVNMFSENVEISNDDDFQLTVYDFEIETIKEEIMENLI